MQQVPRSLKLIFIDQKIFLHEIMKFPKTSVKICLQTVKHEIFTSRLYGVPCQECIYACHNNVIIIIMLEYIIIAL